MTDQRDVEARVHSLFDIYNEEYDTTQEAAASKVVAHLLIEQTMMTKDLLENIEAQLEGLDGLVDSRTR